MNEVIVEAEVENLQDSWSVARGCRRPDEIRRITIPDAVVDTDLVGFSLPARLIEQLGLEEAGEAHRGRTTVIRYDPVRLTVRGRTCVVDVIAVPEDMPALIGIVPLGEMDWVVDREHGRLIGNPAHGGEWMIDLF